MTMTSSSLLDIDDERMSTRETRISVLTFDGRTIEWPTWKVKYLARAQGSKTGRRIFHDKEELQLDENAATDSEGKVDQEVLKQIKQDIAYNDAAYSDLLLSMNTKTAEGKAAFNMIRWTIDHLTNRGNAREAWKKLLEKYQSTQRSRYRGGSCSR